MVASRSKKMHIERVGPYKLGKTIGQGTYGKVKLASHIETGEKVWNAAQESFAWESYSGTRPFR